MTTLMVTAPRTLPLFRTAAANILSLLLALPALIMGALLLRKRAAVVPAPDAAALQSPAACELSVVIPFYNPGTALKDTLTDLISVMDASGVDFEVIAVSDGSTDGSEALIQGLDPRLHVVVQPVNRGKGAALHRGFAEARGQYIGMIDADGDIDASHLVDYLYQARTGGHQVVYADKRHRLSRSASSSSRKLISTGFSTFVGALFKLSVQDTQTGCKLFRREALAKVLPTLREQRFAFDLEFFVAAKSMGINRLHAAPVTLNERMAGSTVGASAIWRTLTDALTIHARLNRTSTYQVPVTHLSHPVAAPALQAA